MKKQFLLGLLFVALFMPMVCAVPVMEYRKMMEVKGRHLTLIGKLDVPPTLKSPPLKPPQQPVQVVQTGTTLEVLFLSNLGNLTITVVNEQAFTVFQQTVNATSGGTLIIGISSWASGNYVIKITDGQGGYLEGAFAK